MTEPLRIEIDDRIADPEEWDELAAASEAPFLYRSGSITQYARTPLQHGTRTRFVRLRRGRTGTLQAALPVFLLPATDPLGVLGQVLPSYTPDAGPLALSHVWHWYDTRVPRRASAAVLGAPLADALHQVGASAGAQVTGLINVTAGDGMLRALRQHGFLLAAIDRRLRADLTVWSSVEGWLGSLDRSVRQDIRRQLRLAREAGCVVRCGPPTPGTASAAARLCAATGDKHGNLGWYPEHQLARLILAWRDRVCLTTISRGSRTLAASVAFVDGRVFHNWAAGTLPYSVLGFSPYAVFLFQSVREALERGCTVLEGGRRNEAWKQRRGLRPVDLYGAFAPVAGSGRTTR